jgi:hypothetical protein
MRVVSLLFSEYAPSISGFCWNVNIPTSKSRCHAYMDSVYLLLLLYVTVMLYRKCQGMMCMCTQTHTHIDTCRHTYYIHRCIHTGTHEGITYIDAYIQAHMHTHIHIQELTEWEQRISPKQIVSFFFPGL